MGRRRREQTRRSFVSVQQVEVSVVLAARRWRLELFASEVGQGLGFAGVVVPVGGHGLRLAGLVAEVAAGPRPIDHFTGGFVRSNSLRLFLQLASVVPRPPPTDPAGPSIAPAKIKNLRYVKSHAHTMFRATLRP